MRIVSKITGQIWRELEQEYKDFYEQMANIFHQERTKFYDDNLGLPDKTRILIKMIEPDNISQEYIRQQQTTNFQQSLQIHQQSQNYQQFWEQHYQYYSI